MELIGIVRIPLNSLVLYGKGRYASPKHIQRLVKILERNCLPDDPDNHISGIITHPELQSILKTLKISNNDLLATTQTPVSYPELYSHKVACLDGVTRLAAARLCKKKPTSWTVKLYCVPGKWIEFPNEIKTTTSVSKQIQKVIEYHSDEAGKRDGDIFDKAWTAWDFDKTDDHEDRWRKLTTAKQGTYNGFINTFSSLRIPPPKDGSDKFTSAVKVQEMFLWKSLAGRIPTNEADPYEVGKWLRKLCRFPGVIDGLQLGNIHKTIAAVPELVENYYANMFKYWDIATGGNDEIAISVDPQSVLDLQSRAPARCDMDRWYISEQFRTNKIFANITDEEARSRLKGEILSLDTIIPSLPTFDSNMAYLSIAVKIIQHYLAPPIKKTVGMNRKPTLFETLPWTAPDLFYVEEEEGLFQIVKEKTPSRRFAFATIIVAALRLFPKLWRIHPRQDGGQPLNACPEAPTVMYFLNLATRMGFSGPKIKESLAHWSRKIRAQQSDSDTHEDEDIGIYNERKIWRCGRPFTKSVQILYSEAFLPKLLADHDCIEGITPGFVLSDIIKKFLGDCSNITRRKPPLSVKNWPQGLVKSPWLDQFMDFQGHEMSSVNDAATSKTPNDAREEVMSLQPDISMDSQPTETPSALDMALLRPPRRIIPAKSQLQRVTPIRSMKTQRPRSQVISTVESVGSSEPPAEPEVTAQSKSGQVVESEIGPAFDLREELGRKRPRPELTSTVTIRDIQASSPRLKRPRLGPFEMSPIELIRKRKQPIEQIRKQKQLRPELISPVEEIRVQAPERPLKRLKYNLTEERHRGNGDLVPSLSEELGSQPLQPELISTASFQGIRASTPQLKSPGLNLIELSEDENMDNGNPAFNLREELGRKRPRPELTSTVNIRDIQASSPRLKRPRLGPFEMNPIELIRKRKQRQTGPISPVEEIRIQAPDRPLKRPKYNPTNRWLMENSSLASSLEMEVDSLPLEEMELALAERSTLQLVGVEPKLTPQTPNIREELENKGLQLSGVSLGLVEDETEYESEETL